MARTVLTTQQVVDEGITPAYVSPAAEGAQFEGTGDLFLHIKNTGSQITATVITGGTLDSEPVADKAVVIPATTGDKMIGPFPPRLYNQPGMQSGGLGVVLVDFSAVAGVTVAAIKV